MKKVSKTNLFVKECIVTSLMQLVEKKPFVSISISEITAHAGVSRMAYYRNYSSKEEIFVQHMEEIVSAYKADVGRVKRQNYYGSYQNILQSFLYFEKYKEFFTCIQKVGMGNILLNALGNYLIDTYYKEESREAYYRLQAYAGALFNVYITWLQRGTEEPAEVMAEIVYRICGCRTGEE